MGLAQGAVLSLIGVVFTYMALKVNPRRALSIYAAGIFIKAVVGTLMVSLTALGMSKDLSMVSYMITIGGVVCVTYPCTAIILSINMKSGNYVRVEKRN